MSDFIDDHFKLIYVGAEDFAVIEDHCPECGFYESECECEEDE